VCSRAGSPLRAGLATPRHTGTTALNLREAIFFWQRQARASFELFADAPLLPKIGASSSFAAFRALKGEPTLVTNSISARYLIMLPRIIHGELKPGTWDDYEEAYFEVIRRVEDLVCMDVTSPEISTIPMPAVASVSGKTRQACGHMKLACC
jgi:hypothetical protein